MFEQHDLFTRKALRFWANLVCKNTFSDPIDAVYPGCEIVTSISTRRHTPFTFRNKTAATETLKYIVIYCTIRKFCIYLYVIRVIKCNNNNIMADNKRACDRIHR